MPARRIPTKILELRGSWRAKGRDGEPTPEVKAPRCPDWLDDEARLEWGRVTKQLVELGCVAVVDRAFLATYCTAWSEMVRMEALIAEADRTGTDLKKSVLLRRDRAADRVARFGGQFGLNPVARTRVRCIDTPGQGDDEMERFLDESLDSFARKRG